MWGPPQPPHPKSISHHTPSPSATMKWGFLSRPQTPLACFSICPLIVSGRGGRGRAPEVEQSPSVSSGPFLLRTRWPLHPSALSLFLVSRLQP